MYNMAMLKKLNKNSYADALDEIIRLLETRRVSLDEKHVLIVPDVYTFALEKRLFLGKKGAFDLEVTTFNRLYTRLVEGKKALPKQGAIMLLKDICRRSASELTYYSRSASVTGFSVKLYDALKTLRACELTPEAIRDANAMKKSGDLALLYSRYLSELDGRYVDAAGRNALLTVEPAFFEYLENAHVYIALYDVFSADMRRLLSVVEQNALSVTVALSSVTPDDNRISAECEARSYSDAPSQYKAIAAKIKAYVADGGAYGDVCVVCDGASAPVVTRIFAEYGVPYYAGEKLPLSGCELARFIDAASRAALRKYRTDDMLALAENYYIGASKSDVDAFYGYVREKSVDYLRFTSEFKPDGKTPPELTEGAERVRKSVMAAVNVLEGSFGSAKSYASALFELFDSVNASEKTKELDRADGRRLKQCYDKMRELIVLLSETCGGSGEELLDTLNEGLAGTEISPVPNSPDTVQLGPLSQFRGQRPGFAVIADFNDGALPMRVEDDGLLTDADADKLEEYRLFIEPSTESKNELCRGELWHFMKAARRLLVTYVKNDEKKASYELLRMCRQNGISIISDTEEREAVLYGGDSGAIARYLGCESGALEATLLDPELLIAPSVLAAASEDKRAVIEKKINEKSIGDGKALFMRGKTTSVSALQTYFTCPYKYFLSYGLRLKKKEEGAVSAIDVGSFLHKIAEIFVTEGMPEDRVAFVDRTIKRVLSGFEKYSYKQNERVLSRVRSEAIELCGVIARQLNAGSFKSIGTEQSFGKVDSALKTVVLPSGVSLNGNIDRTDVYRSYARVIDYKTGSTKFSYTDLYYGRKLQLTIYMCVLMENGYMPAGTFYLPLSSSWTDDEFTHRLDGPFLGDEELLLAHDSGLVEGGKSSVIEVNVTVKPDGTLSPRKSGKLRTAGELKALCDYAVAAADKAVEEIYAGNITPSPAFDGRRNACEYCEYAAVCGAEAEARRCTDGGFEDIYAAFGLAKTNEAEE